MAASNHETGRQAFEVPLPRAGQRLVEVVQIEHDVALRCGEEAEVGQMGIAARLDVQAAPRNRGEVLGHHRRRTAQKREWRARHPAVSNRHEVRQPILGLLLQDGDRIRPRSTWREVGVARPRSHVPESPAGLHTVRDTPTVVSSGYRGHATPPFPERAARSLGCAARRQAPSKRTVGAGASPRPDETVCSSRVSVFHRLALTSPPTLRWRPRRGRLDFTQFGRGRGCRHAVSSM
jgi:hypothetical protein